MADKQHAEESIAAATAEIKQFMTENKIGLFITIAYLPDTGTTHIVAKGDSTWILVGLEVAKDQMIKIARKAMG
jgi:hypothetical protein